jgi:hypothetical protein
MNEQSDKKEEDSFLKKVLYNLIGLAFFLIGFYYISVVWEMMLENERWLLEHEGPVRRFSSGFGF